MNAILNYILELNTKAKACLFAWITTVLAYSYYFITVNKYIFFEDVLFFLLTLNAVNLICVVLLLFLNGDLASVKISARGRYSDKSWFKTFALNLLFGLFGAHRFYVGKRVSGLVYLFSLGLFGFGYVFDAVSLLLCKFTDSTGKALVYNFNSLALFNIKKSINAIFGLIEKIIGFIARLFNGEARPVERNNKPGKTRIADDRDSGKKSASVKRGNDKRDNGKIVDIGPRNTGRNDSVIFENEFLRDIIKYKNFVVRNAEFVPFYEYKPTYRKMTSKQQKWYFYWRFCARNKDFLKTDTSYIYLLFYELICGIGWDDAQEGYEKMLDLWLAYREDHPELDDYLPGWLFDFSLAYNVEFYLPDLVDLPVHNNPLIIDVIIDKKRADKTLKLPLSVIDELCDYSIVGSKFYKNGNQLLITEAIPRVIALVDAYLLKNTKKGILDTYGPVKAPKTVHNLFKNVEAYSGVPKVELSVKRYTTSTKLRSFVNEVVRFSENFLRETYNARGRLRGVSLDEKTAAIIKIFLLKEYSPKTDSPEENVEPPVNVDVPKNIDVPKVKLNFDNINNLRKESDDVRRVLNVPDDNKNKRTVDFDLETITELYKAIPKYCILLLNDLHNNQWEMEYNPLLQASIDKINELSGIWLACSILVSEADLIILEDDFRDEFNYIYDHIDEIIASDDSQDNTQSLLFNTDDMEGSMKALFDMLSATQIEIIYLIMKNENVASRLEEIAFNEMSMPEILIDEINDISLQVIGDIIIENNFDVFSVLDEYSCQLEKYVK